MQKQVLQTQTPQPIDLFSYDAMPLVSLTVR